MINGNANDFLNHSTYEEVAILYKQKKYFFYGIMYNHNTRLFSYEIDLWDDNGMFVEHFYKNSSFNNYECLNIFQEAKLWDGRDFWQAECEMEWVDW